MANYNVGTHDTTTLEAVRNARVVEIGEDVVARGLQADLAAHNAIFADMASDLVEISEDVRRRYGDSVDSKMYKVDEFGRVPTQRAVAGSNVDFPLEKYAHSVGYTREFLEMATVNDVVAKAVMARKADIQNLREEASRALFRATNFSFIDRHNDRVELAVKALVNADNAPIPPWQAQSFDAATHTHYVGRAGGSLALADLESLVTNVFEHGHTSGLRLVIHKGDEATVRTILPVANLYQDPRISYRVSNTTTQTLDLVNVNNRAIGILSNGAEVWVKPWAVQGYAFAYAAGDSNKPLVMRESKIASRKGLRMAGEIDLYPLRTEYMERYFGLGVWTRTNGACLYFGGTSYVVPNI
jgi:hypothetical protein